MWHVVISCDSLHVWFHCQCLVTICSNRKLHEIAAYLNLISLPTDDVDNVYSQEFLLELLVSYCRLHLTEFSLCLSLFNVFNIWCVWFIMVCGVSVDIGYVFYAKHIICMSLYWLYNSLQCFDVVDWTTGSASGLWWNGVLVLICWLWWCDWSYSRFWVLTDITANCHLHHFLLSKIQNCFGFCWPLTQVVVVVCKVFLQIIIVILLFPFSVLTLLVGDRKGIWLVKSLVLVCWWWWCDWSFARLLLQLSPPLPSSSASVNTGLPRFTWKNGHYNGERENCYLHFYCFWICWKPCSFQILLWICLVFTEGLCRICTELHRYKLLFVTRCLDTKDGRLSWSH